MKRLKPAHFKDTVNVYVIHLRKTSIKNCQNFTSLVPEAYLGIFSYLNLSLSFPNNVEKCSLLLNVLFHFMNFKGRVYVYYLFLKEKRPTFLLTWPSFFFLWISPNPSRKRNGFLFAHWDKVIQKKYNHHSLRPSNCYENRILKNIQ